MTFDVHLLPRLCAPLPSTHTQERGLSAPFPQSLQFGCLPAQLQSVHLQQAHAEQLHALHLQQLHFDSTLALFMTFSGGYGGMPWRKG